MIAHFCLGTPIHILEEIERLQDKFGKLIHTASSGAPTEESQPKTVAMITLKSLTNAMANFA